MNDMLNQPPDKPGVVFRPPVDANQVSPASAAVSMVAWRF